MILLYKSTFYLHKSNIYSDVEYFKIIFIFVKKMVKI